MSVTIGTWRFGEAYECLDTVELKHVITGKVAANMDVANAGMIRRDATRRAPAAFATLQAIPIEARLDAIERAAHLFETAALGLGDPVLTPEEHVQLQSATTGLPQTLCRMNLIKVASVCRQIRQVFRGLTRGLDPAVLQTGVGLDGDLPVGFAPVARSLSGVMPSNSPGVHTLWVPALAFGVPVALKPGGSEPWTPSRLISALIAAGLPGDAFGFYPTDHAGAEALTEHHDRSLVFGGADTVARFAGRPSVSVHGPGYAAVVLGADEAPHWSAHLPIIVDSMIRNGGRSCINASTVVVPTGFGDLVADALAEQMDQVLPRGLADPKATLAGFPSASVADAIDARIRTFTAVNARVATRSPRRAAHDGLAFLRPTVVRCGPEHPLARAEYGFPFVAVVEMPVAPPQRWATFLGERLVVTAITRDPALRSALLSSPSIDRLHLGPVPTCEIRWDQPHEGNLFEWLIRRRAVAVAW